MKGYKALTRAICPAVVLSTVVSIPFAQAATPDAEEMWKIIQQQQKVIEQLQQKLEQTNEKVEVAEQKVEEATQEVEAAAEAIETAQTSTGGSSWADKTSVGGYGELHYNRLTDQQTADGSDDLDQIDFHRFVLYFGHEFSDDVRFFSELEIEHAFLNDSGGNSNGAVELEQAWIEVDVNDQHRFRAGLDVVPVGIINPLHEPNTFYGVERNRVEVEIIPSTWREAGAALLGEIAPGWNYHLFAHTGLAVPTSGSNPFRIRSGRTQLDETQDIDLATTGRLTYTGMPGLEAGISINYQNDYTGTADNLDISAVLLEGHVDYKHSSGFGLRALYAHWNVEDDPNVVAVNGDSLDGYYIEPAYRFDPNFLKGELGIFLRYSGWDERNRLGGSAFEYEKFNRITTGFNWWPHPNVAFKFDYQDESTDGPVDRELDGWNLGVGYQF